ncbi:MAG TPA: TIGR04282 family arsenosugar biosynthesis glycosyltransferase [Parvularculaceae bacterium]|nr:TIGR04282 family arsenosugar biosynthesis glycosyltransferase [Parvularculaceae bacterium]
MRGTLIIFAKAPVAGRVKTRLGADIGMARAAMLFRLMTAQTVAAASNGPWRTMIAIDPPAAAAGYGALWPQRFERLIQSNGDLGRRMADVFARAPRGPAIIIGADAPGVRAVHIRKAFGALAGHDAVFGPATDGGYWLIGLAGRRAASGLFDGVRWSSEHALADTIGGLPAGFGVAMIDRLRDMDDACDLKSLGARAFFRSLARL